MINSIDIRQLSSKIQELATEGQAAGVANVFMGFIRLMADLNDLLISGDVNAIAELELTVRPDEPETKRLALLYLTNPHDPEVVTLFDRSRMAAERLGFAHTLLDQAPAGAA